MHGCSRVRTCSIRRRGSLPSWTMLEQHHVPVSMLALPPWLHFAAPVKTLKLSKHPSSNSTWLATCLQTNILLSTVRLQCVDLTHDRVMRQAVCLQFQKKQEKKISNFNPWFFFALLYYLLINSGKLPPFCHCLKYVFPALSFFANQTVASLTFSVQ